MAGLLTQRLGEATVELYVPQGRAPGGGYQQNNNSNNNEEEEDEEEKHTVKYHIPCGPDHRSISVSL